MLSVWQSSSNKIFSQAFKKQKFTNLINLQKTLTLPKSEVKVFDCSLRKPYDFFSFQCYLKPFQVIVLVHCSSLKNLRGMIFNNNNYYLLFKLCQAIDWGPSFASWLEGFLVYFRSKILMAKLNKTNTMKGRQSILSKSAAPNNNALLQKQWWPKPMQNNNY